MYVFVNEVAWYGPPGKYVQCVRIAELRGANVVKGQMKHVIADSRSIGCGSAAMGTS